MKRHTFLFKNINFFFLILVLTGTPFIMPNAVVDGGKPIVAPAAATEEISVPLFGKAVLSAPKTPGGEQEGTLADTTLAGVSFTQLRVKKTANAMTVTTLVTFAGVQFQAEYTSATKTVVLNSATVYDFVIKSPDGKPLTLLGITLEDAHLKIETSPSVQVQIAGKVKFLGLVFDAGFSVAADINALFFATLSPEIKEWRPFAGVGIPDLEAIVVNDLQAGVKAGADIKAVAGQVKTAVVNKVKGIDADQASKKEGGLFASLFITGSSTILNVKSQVLFNVGYQKDGFAVTGIAQLPDGWKLSQSFPQLFAVKNPVTDALDLLKIVKAEVVISSRDGKIFYNNSQQTVNKGLSLSAAISLDEPYENDILKVINSVLRNISVGVTQGTSGGKAGIMLQGVIPPDIKNLRLQVGVTAGDITFDVGPAKFYGGQFNFIVKGEPSLGFGGSFKMKPTEKDEPLNFDLEFEFTPIKFGLAGSMVGVWKNPFGIKGFQFGNLGLRGTQTYTAIAEAAAAAAATAGIGSLTVLIPADAGIAGEVTLGDGPDAILAKAQINLGKDISSIGIVAEVKNPVTLPRLIEILLKQMGASITIINIIPFNLRDIKVYFVPMGTSVGKVQLKQGVGFSGCADVFGKKACVDVGLDLTRGAAVKGTIEQFDIGALKFTGANGQGDPTIDAELGPQKQVFKVSGQAVLADIIKSNTDILLSLQGMNFTLESEFGPAGGKIGTIIKGSTGPITDIAKAFEPGQVKLSIDFKNDLTALLNKKIDDFIVERKKVFEEDVNKTIAQVARRASQEDIKQQQAAVAYTESRRVGFVDDPLLSIAREADVQKETFALGLLKIKYDLEKTPLGEFVRKALDDLGISKLIEKALTDVRNLGVGAFNAGQFTFNKVANIAVVKKLSWSGSLSDIKDGTIKGLDLEIELSGQLVTRKMEDFDLRDPLGSIAKVAQQVIGLAVDGIKAAISGVPVAKNSCELLQAHIDYWNINAIKDANNVKYDGDWTRGQWLLGLCQKENPSVAQTLQSQLLAGSGCYELTTHIKYWTEHGGVDLDPLKGQKHLRQCTSENPELARKLLVTMPGSGCYEYARHMTYWNPRGYDGDPEKGKGHLAQCKKEDPKLAQTLIQKFTGNGPLLNAAMEGDLPTLVSALNAGEDKETKDKYGSTALIIAADRNYLQIVQELVARGANVNAVNGTGKNAAFYAASHNYNQILDILKNASPDIALIDAAMKNDLSGVQNAINKGANKEAKDEYGSTALILAADRNYLQIVQELVARGANKDAANGTGKTAEFYARSHNYTQVLDILGKRVLVAENPGPDCRAYADHLDYWSKKGYDGDPGRGVMLRNKCDGESPCFQLQRHMDYWAGKTDLDPMRKASLTTLCDRSKQVSAPAQVVQQATAGQQAFLNQIQQAQQAVQNIVNNVPVAQIAPAQALLNAAMAGDLSGVMNALNKGAGKDDKDGYGSTALIVAADRNHMNIVNELVARGADRNIRNQYGKTAKDYATERGFTEIVNRLNTP